MKKEDFDGLFTMLQRISDKEFKLVYNCPNCKYDIEVSRKVTNKCPNCGEELTNNEFNGKE